MQQRSRERKKEILLCLTKTINSSQWHSHKFLNGGAPIRDISWFDLVRYGSVRILIHIF